MRRSTEKTLFPIILCAAFAATNLYGQDEQTTPDEEEAAVEETIDPAKQPVLSDLPLVSARSAGMAGALSPIADDVDAVFHNPAGIGGRRWGKKKVPWIRKLYLPHLTASSNRNATKLNQDFKDQEGSRDATIGEAIVDAHSGKPQYARANFLMGMVLGRTLVMPYYDTQFAAVSKGEGTGLIDAHYRTMSGVAFGTSVSDGEGYFSLGYSGYTASVSDMRGDLEYGEIISLQSRNAAIKEQSHNYSGFGHNLGLSLRLGKTAAPTLSIVSRNMGGTELTPKDSTVEPIKIAEDLTAGFSVSPGVGKWGLLHIVTEVGRLTDNEVTVAKKYRLGLELVGGLSSGMDSYALWAVRAGYNDAGACYGLSLNLGLIGLTVSDESIDVGTNNNRVTERRFTALMYVNVAEF